MSSSSILKDALHHALTRHPALIITDLHMPKMDGLELLRTVQASA